MRWGIAPNITLNASVNPSFSQVEADVAQLNVYGNAAVCWQEAQPFFLDDAELRTIRRQAVYTRTIAGPDRGVKPTGKEGTNAIGFGPVEGGTVNLTESRPPNSHRTQKLTN